MVDLSILIPSRHEMFLARTIEDIIEHAEGNTEVIAVLDGEWADPPIEDHPMVTLVHLHQSIGQRAATNLAAKLSEAKYVMKIDAHCAFDQGFDVKMMADMQDDWTMVPIMRNLHVFDWVCEDGHRRYQGNSGPCVTCDKETHREMVWIGKNNPQSTSYCFDPEPHFQYFREFKKRPEGKGDLTESMSLQGSCFMLTRDKYWELDICGEEFGSWGSQGIEVAVKTWLSGGRVMVNHKTWYAHAFRTKGGDWGFPYPLSGKQVSRAKKYAKTLFFNDQWPGQERPLSWLVKRFWPVPGWTEDDLAKISGEKAVPESKGIVYYTDNGLTPEIAEACRKQLEMSCNGHDLVSASLLPIDFGRNVTLDQERGILTMFRQILAGLEDSTADIIFFAEHDVLYHPSHFDFVPERDDVFYYNTNVWKVRADDGHAMRTEKCQQTSGLCARRELLLEHYRKRVALVEENGFTRNMGFEPGTHGREQRVDDYKSISWESEQPNIDIRHDRNLTPSRWSKDQFRNQRYTKGWVEAKEVPGWGRFDSVMSELVG